MSRLHSRKHKYKCMCVCVCVLENLSSQEHSSVTQNMCMCHTLCNPLIFSTTTRGPLCCVCVHVRLCEDADSLMAATRSDHHVAVFLEDDIGAVIEVEHRDGVELCGGTTRLRNRLRVNKVNLGREKSDSSIHDEGMLIRALITWTIGQSKAGKQKS